MGEQRSELIKTINTWLAIYGTNREPFVKRFARSVLRKDLKKLAEMKEAARPGRHTA